MTEKEAAEMLQAKLTCMKFEDLSCVGEGCSRDCNDCEYNYKQGTIGEHEKVLELAIKALKEVQQYREIGTVEQVKNQKHNLEVAYKIIGNYQGIGTVEECREAREKQKSKKPKLNYRRKFLGEDIYTCPTCGNVCLKKYANERQNNNFCWDCGQAIDWSEEE